MKKDIPKWGSVSHDRSRFTIYFACTGNSAKSMVGHNKEVFGEYNIPIVRFDKTSLDNVLSFIQGPAFSIEETSIKIPNSYNIRISMAEFFSELERHGIPIDYDGYVE